MTTAKDAIRMTLGSADMILNAYVGDLTDEDCHRRMTTMVSDEQVPSICWALRTTGPDLERDTGW